MGNRRESESEPELTSRRPPANTPQGRENQLISLAMDLAERRLLEGTATSQEIVHFLKLASSREQLEQARIQQENLLTQAKIDQMKAAENVEKLYAEAAAAMVAYGGNQPRVDYDDYP